MYTLTSKRVYSQVPSWCQGKGTPTDSTLTSADFLLIVIIKNGALYF